MVAITSATSRASTGDVRPAPKGSRIVPSLAIDSAAQAEEEEVLEEDRGSDMHDGQARPVQHLLGQPMLPLLGRVRHLGQAHLRHGHLGDVDEHLQITTLARHGGGGDGRLQVGRGHAHAEVHAPATRQGPRDVPGTGEVADDDLGAGCRAALRHVHLRAGPARGPAGRAGEASPR